MAYKAHAGELCELLLVNQKILLIKLAEVHKSLLTGQSVELKMVLMLWNENYYISLIEFLSRVIIDK
jgi:hypothetical protein